MPSQGRSGSRPGTGDDPAAGVSVAELLVFQSELFDGAEDRRDAKTRCRSFHMHDRAHPNTTPRSRADRCSYVLSRHWCGIFLVWFAGVVEGGGRGGLLGCGQDREGPLG